MRTDDDLLSNFVQRMDYFDYGLTPINVHIYIRATNIDVTPCLIWNIA
jgi:hypothetical protein